MILDPDQPLIETVADLVDRYGFKAVLYEVERHTPLAAVGSAPARRGDPETSHLAAKRDPDLSKFRSSSRKAKLLGVFRAGDFTAQQAAGRVVGYSATPSAFDGCRRRTSDLVAAGMIFDSGRRRKNPGSDEESIVWTITLVGEQALDCLEATGWSK